MGCDAIQRLTEATYFHLVPYKIHVVDYTLTSINSKFHDVMWLMAESQHLRQIQKQHTQSTMKQIQSATQV